MSVVNLVGAPVTLTCTVAGEAATLAVIEPDGAPVTPAPAVSVVQDKLTATFTPTKPGRHVLTWQVTGGAVESDVLDVWPETPRYLVSKADAHERLTRQGGGAALGASKWDALPLYIAAATAVVEAEVGPIIPHAKTYKTFAAHPRNAIVLPAHDVTVTSITVDGAHVPVDVNLVDDSAGVIHGDFLGKIVVEYSVGDNQVHPLARLACLELIAHSWQSQRESARTANREVGDDQVATSAGYYVPRRVSEMLAQIRQHRGIA